ncbi:hypothetical protein Q5P01_003826 [Channa striata]|uniref:Uncharacterized protein n=1 Tax=Channa striata TaxID=64152 RepID=A0AA88NN38_CHASR|nr:hypothetical protein Q5P01_003826 [Channa striata]
MQSHDLYVFTSQMQAGKPAGVPQLGGRLRTLPIRPAQAAHPAAKSKRHELRAGTQRAPWSRSRHDDSRLSGRPPATSNSDATMIIINNVAPVCLPFRPSVRRSVASANPAPLGTGLSPRPPARLPPLVRQSLTRSGLIYTHMVARKKRKIEAKRKRAKRGKGSATHSHPPVRSTAALSPSVLQSA